MSNRRTIVLILIANLLTVALVTGAFQAVSLLAHGPVPQGGTILAIDHDPTLAPWVPSTMNYQGILKDSGGNPLNGQHNLTFTIYRWDAIASQLVNVWTETHNDVQIANGLFNVALGSKGTPLTAAIFSGLGESGTWHGGTELGIKVDGGTELSPRISMRTVPYAHRAEYVNRFPAPHYDSGWQDFAVGTHTDLTHNLGGNVDDYVVDLQFKDSDGTDGINNIYYGIDFDGSDNVYGVTWRKLTATQITIWRGDNDFQADQVRVRIWRIK